MKKKNVFSSVGVLLVKIQAKKCNKFTRNKGPTSVHSRYYNYSFKKEKLQQYFILKYIGRFKNRSPPMGKLL
jgi:hypothetical protein